MCLDRSTKLHNLTFSEVSLGKFGTFNSNNLIGKPYGISYEIIKDGDIRPVGHVSKNTSVGN